MQNVLIATLILYTPQMSTDAAPSPPLDIGGPFSQNIRQVRFGCVELVFLNYPYHVTIFVACQ